MLEYILACENYVTKQRYNQGRMNFKYTKILRKENKEQEKSSDKETNS